jgi:hypothetical protein
MLFDRILTLDARAQVNGEASVLATVTAETLFKLKLIVTVVLPAEFVCCSR